MGRQYAGTLGPIAFVTVIVRNLIDGGHADSALMAALMALFAFAALGYLLGRMAEHTIVEAVESSFHARLRASEQPHPGAPMNDGITGGNGAAA
jgi:hypothetical protein